ncbi:hypothetical protein [Rubritalea sp.]|uniref:hypothetical protein n=1 Tax=Rubritalea sp. TaxID=2109375 RepID=UPI003EF7EED5
MKQLLLLLLALQTCLCHAEEWTIHWIAAKGDLKATISPSPKTLDHYFTSLPSGHLEADQDIQSGHTPATSSIRLLGTFKDRKIFTLTHEVKGSYYSRYHVILAEVQAKKYIPLYVHQYNLGHEKPVALTFVGHNSTFTITSSIQFVGQGVGNTKEHYAVTSNLTDPPILKHTTTY